MGQSSQVTIRAELSGEELAVRAVVERAEQWMMGTVVYAEPFWALDCVGLRP